MTLREILEEDKERFLSAAGEARNAGEAGDAVRAELGRMLAVYNEQAETDAEREAAKQMLTACAGAAALTDSSGDPVIYTSGRTETARREPAFRKIMGKRGAAPLVRRAAEIVLPAAGAACLGAVPLSLLLTGQAAASAVSVPGLFILTALGGVFVYLAGRQRAVVSALPGEQAVSFAEVTPDPERIYHHLTTMAAVLDQNLTEVRGRNRIAERTARSAEDAGEDPALTELMSELLETVYAQEDKEAAQDITSEIRYFLHGRGIAAEDYDGSNGEAFDLLPGQAEETLRPALTADGRVLRKGLATRRSGG